MEWSFPPVICGFNQAEPKNNSEVLVWMNPIKTDGARITLGDRLPLVIKGEYGKGRTIACLTDLAPHWCGGLVDWGEKRLKLAAVEVGDKYTDFIKFLVEI